MTALRRKGLFIVVLALLVAGAVWSLPFIIRSGLKIMGVGGITFETLDVGLNETRIRHLEIGNPPNQHLADLQIEYSPLGLIGGQIDRVAIDGLSIDAEFRDGELRLLDDQETDEGAPFQLSTMLVPREIVIKNSRIDLESPLGRVAIPIAGSLVSEGDDLRFAVSVSDARLTSGEGLIEADLDIRGRLPIMATPALEQIIASGSLKLDATRAELPGFIADLSGGGDIALDLADGVLTASTETLIAHVDRVLLGDRELGGPWKTMVGEATTPMQLTGRPHDEGWRFSLDGPMALTGPMGTAKAAVGVEVDLDDQFRISRVGQGDMAIDLARIAFEGATLDEGRVDLQIEGTSDILDGSLDLKLDGFGWSAAGVTVAGVKLEQKLDLALRERLLSITPETGKKINIDKITVSDDLESGWFTVHWRENEIPWLRIDLDDGRFAQRLDAEIDPVRLETKSGQFWARIEDLIVTMAGDPNGIETGRAVIEGGRADLPSANIAFAGIESDIRLDESGLAADQATPLTIRSIRPADEPRWFTPLRLDATLRPQPKQISFDGQVTTRTQPPARLEFSGLHDWENVEGSLDLKLAPLTFAPGGLQPADLSPGLEDVLQDAVGRLALDGEITWQEGGLFSDLALLIEELGFAIGPARLERINSVIQFDNVAPLTTPADQLLSVGLLDVGLPLTDGLVSMQLRADGSFAVDQLAWHFADGRVLAEPFTFGSDVQDLTMMLKADQLDLDGLLGLTQLDDLAGEGRIDGILPLTIGEAAAAIAGGELSATGPGVLRYKPKEAPGVLQAGGESVRLMLQALENFRYDALRITLDGRTDGAMDIGLHLKGANPELYEGHPIEFNLNLDGNLASLIQTNLDNYQIPDRIRERIQGFER